MDQRRLMSDGALGAMFRAADRGGIWLVSAAALAVAGGRRGRRAAARGLLAAVVAQSGAAATKAVARRRRPPRSLVTRAAVRPVRPRTPTTSSFPSSHTAAGAAFAAAAAMELPLAGLPLGATAALVGWSRVRIGMHRRSDVLAGAAVGLAAAMATRRVWPVPSRLPARARPSASVDGRPRPGGAGIEVVVNAASGTGPGGDGARRMRLALPAATVVEVEDPADLLSTLETAAGRAEVVGICGGDGSVNVAAEVAHRAGLPLLVAPGGTLNHFAQALGIDSMDRAVEAAEGGRCAAVDLACVADRPFLNVASFGIYVDLVRAREEWEDGIGKWPALLAALVRVLPRAQPVEVEIDGRARRLWLCFVGNCQYHPEGFAPAWRERLDDGVLDVRLVDARPTLARTRLAVSLLTGRLSSSRALEVRRAATVEVVAHAPLGVAADGEVFEAPARFTVAKRGEPLSVLVPPD